MSYCRFGSDNFKSDVYAWEDCGGGYRIQVASMRIVGDVPDLPNILTTPRGEWVNANKKRKDFLESCTRVNIGLEHDGEYISVSSVQDLLETFLMLREAGYHVPQSAIDCAKDEAMELAERITKQP